MARSDIHISLESVPRFLQAMQEGVAKDLEDILVDAVHDALVNVQTDALQADLVGIRVPGYVESFEVERVHRGAVLLNKAPYADAIEFGTRPYKPPFVPIKEWAEHKLGLPPDVAGAVTAEVIRRVEREGFRPHHILTANALALEADIRRRFRSYGRAFSAGRSKAAIRLKTSFGERGKRPSITI